MKQLYQALNLARPIPGMFGIEIEAEGKHMGEVANKLWHTEDDGSLRGNFPDSRAEFVLNKPVTRENVLPALDNLRAELDGFGAEFAFSYRTSVHIHMNVQELTHAQLMNVIYTYLLLEEPLMNFCGKSRKANRFCLRLGDAEGVLDTMKMLFKGGFKDLNNFQGDKVRYCAINLAALQKYGSLEFRAMRGNIDPAIIKTWTEALYAIREYSVKTENPKAVLAHLERVGVKAFMKEILGDVYGSFIYPRMVKEMQRSFSLSLDLPYSYVNHEEAVGMKALEKKIKAIEEDKVDDVVINPGEDFMAVAHRILAKHPLMPVDDVLEQAKRQLKKYKEGLVRNVQLPQPGGLGGLFVPAAPPRARVIVDEFARPAIPAAPRPVRPKKLVNPENW